jgi:hypothetical protein
VPQAREGSFVDCQAGWSLPVRDRVPRRGGSLKEWVDEDVWVRVSKEHPVADGS